LWSTKFWDRHWFRNWAHVRRAKPCFDDWYDGCYRPPSLNGQTVRQAMKQAPRVRLTAKQAAAE